MSLFSKKKPACAIGHVLLKGTFIHMFLRQKLIIKSNDGKKEGHLCNCNGISNHLSVEFAISRIFQLPGKREISRPKSISREISREKLYPGFAACSI